MDQVVQIILDYVEGRMSINEFKQEFDSNKSLQKKLNRPIQKVFLKNYNYSILNFLVRDLQHTKGNWDTINVRKEVQVILEQWLDSYNIAYNEYKRYREDAIYLLDIQPSWLNIIDDQGMFDKLLAERPKDISKAQQIKWGKERLKELFRYDKTYPRWIQSPEWPIVNGKPLVFSHQRKEKGDDERTYYYFYDPETQKETIIEQFY